VVTCLLSSCSSEARGKLSWIDGFLSPSQCGAILDELRFAFWQPSGVSMRTVDGAVESIISSVRVSRSTDQSWFTPSLLRLMHFIVRQLQPFVPGIRQRAEPWQATRYHAGGKFDYHCDAGHWRHEPGGERVHTVLIYLNTPRRGGSTCFSALNVEVKAQVGRLLVWKNLDRYGRCDPSMVHCSAPLSGGSKTVLVTWVRQRKFREPDRLTHQRL
jgi:2OG-Fe(II) oxygenase superfamily